MDDGREQKRDISPASSRLVWASVCEEHENNSYHLVAVATGWCSVAAWTSPSSSGGKGIRCYPSTVRFTPARGEVLVVLVRTSRR